MQTQNRGRFLSTSRMKKQTIVARNSLYIEDQDEKPAFKWDELPRDVFASILSRLRTAELLTRVQYVSRLWREACSDPLMWRRVCIGKYGDFRVYPYPKDDDERLRRAIELHSPRNGVYRWIDCVCRLAVDRSLGSLESFAIQQYATDDLLHYVADRSCRLKHLRLAFCYTDRLTKEGVISVSAKVPFLEELEILNCNIAEEVIEAFARNCPLLVSFMFTSWSPVAYRVIARRMPRLTDFACRVIAHRMPRLVHLKLGGQLKNDELQAILDGCPCLKSLDLYYCRGIDLYGELGLTFRERIKEFRPPYDPANDGDYLDW